MLKPRRGLFFLGLFCGAAIGVIYMKIKDSKQAPCPTSGVVVLPISSAALTSANNMLTLQFTAGPVTASAGAAKVTLYELGTNLKLTEWNFVLISPPLDPALTLSGTSNWTITKSATLWPNKAVYATISTSPGATAPITVLDTAITNVCAISSSAVGAGSNIHFVPQISSMTIVRPPLTPTKANVTVNFAIPVPANRNVFCEYQFLKLNTSGKKYDRIKFAGLSSFDTPAILSASRTTMTFTVTGLSVANLPTLCVISFYGLPGETYSASKAIQ